MPEELNTPAAEPDPETEPETQEEPSPESSSRNSTLAAIDHCRKEYNAAYIQYRDNNGGRGKASTYSCEKEGSEAYCIALPMLSSRQNILNFIACVADGVLWGAIPANTSSKLIYAAQAALGALPREPKPRKKAKKRTPPHPRGVKKDNRAESQLTSSQQAA